MEQMTMKHAMEAEGPFTVVLKDGQLIKAAEFDGGGVDFTEPGGTYEVHGHLLDGGFLNIEQRRIERVLDVRGDEVEFGNRYMPGHPRQMELPPNARWGTAEADSPAVWRSSDA